MLSTSIAVRCECQDSVADPVQTCPQQNGCSAAGASRWWVRRQQGNSQLKLQTNFVPTMLFAAAVWAGSESSSGPRPQYSLYQHLIFQCRPLLARVRLLSSAKLFVFACYVSGFCITQQVLGWIATVLDGSDPGPLPHALQLDLGSLKEYVAAPGRAAGINVRIANTPGLLQRLATLLHSNDAAVYRPAAEVLRQLAADQDVDQNLLLMPNELLGIRRRIADSGVTPGALGGLVRLVNNGQADSWARQAAAQALRNVSAADDLGIKRQVAGTDGAVAGLVQLLDPNKPEPGLYTRQAATQALRNLSAAADAGIKQQIASSHSAIRWLGGLLRNPNEWTQQAAVQTLRNLMQEAGEPDWTAAFRAQVAGTREVKEALRALLQSTNRDTQRAATEACSQLDANQAAGMPQG